MDKAQGATRNVSLLVIGHPAMAHSNLQGGYAVGAAGSFSAGRLAGFSRHATVEFAVECCGCHCGDKRCASLICSGVNRAAAESRSWMRRLLYFARAGYCENCAAAK